MPKGYEFFDHTADVGVNVHGETLEELFRNAAAALHEALGSLARGEERREKSVKLEAPTLEDLLHDWLAELLYEVETNCVLYDEIASLTVCRNGAAAPTFELQATLRGGLVDFDRSQTNEEIKAVTYHQLRVERTSDGQWRATVIFDV
jgi:SHS2 domain-containing protein